MTSSTSKSSSILPYNFRKVGRGAVYIQTKRSSWSPSWNMLSECIRIRTQENIITKSVHKENFNEEMNSLQVTRDVNSLPTKHLISLQFDQLVLHNNISLVRTLHPLLVQVWNWFQAKRQGKGGIKKNWHMEEPT